MTRIFIVLIFFLSTLTLLHAQQSPADPLRVNEVFHRAPLSKALKTIQTKYNVRIAYDNALVQNVVVDLVLTDLTVRESLERLLRGTSLVVNAVGENFVIVPAAPEKAMLPMQQSTLKLSGVVLDEASNETLPNAVIRISGTNLAVTSNDDGHFTILQVPGDTCTVDISYMGYITQSIRVADIPEPGQMRIRMKSDTKILNEVVLVDEYNQAIQIQPTPGAFAFNPRSLSTLPSLGEQDLSRTMQLMPGVTATDESSSGMVIRGMHSSTNLVTLDGMTIYQQDHCFGAFSIINADIVKDVRVQKGMFDAKYGGRSSGVVDITAKNGNTVRPGFNVKLNSMNVKAIAEVPLGKKWSVFMGARRSITDVVQSPLFKDLFSIARQSNDQIQLFQIDQAFGGTGAEPSYAFYDTYGKITFRASTRDVVSLSLYTSRDQMKIDDDISYQTDPENFFKLNDQEYTRWGNYGASLRWGRQWGDKFYTNVRISDSKFFRRYDYDQGVELPEMMSNYQLLIENNISDLSFAYENEWLYRDNVTFELGYNGVRQNTLIKVNDLYEFSGDFEVEEPEDVGMSEKDDSWLHTVYASATITLTDKLTATAGARLNHYYNQEGTSHIEPRISVQYKWNESFNLKGAYGRSNQFVSQLVYYSPTGSVSGLAENVWRLADPVNGAPVPDTDHFTAGATVKSKSLVYDAEVYYKTSAGVLIDEDYNGGDAEVYGVDLMVQKTTGIHKGWIAYTLARGTQSHPMMFNGKAVPSWQDQRHELKVVNMLALGSWNLSSTIIYGSGKPYPKYTVIWNYDEYGIIDDYDTQLDYSNQSRLPAYFKIDLAASYRTIIKERVDLEVGLSINNVTNHENIKTRRLDTAALDEAVFSNVEVPATYRDVKLLGFMPSLFVSVTF